MPAVPIPYPDGAADLIFIAGGRQGRSEGGRGAQPP